MRCPPRLSHAGLAVLGLLLVGACSELRTVALDEDDGILPFYYQDTFTLLPQRWSADEVPDGRYVLEAYDGRDVVLTIETGADGGRDVDLRREALLLSASNAQLYRDFFGEDQIRGIRAVELELVELEVAGMDAERMRPTLAVGGDALAEGRPARLDDSTVDALRSSLLRGDEVRVPFGLSFHLPAAQLDALPSKLQVLLVVQPTLYVDVLDAI